MPDNLDRTLKAEINLYYDFRPAPQTNAPLLISLHGYGANKRQMMRESRLIAPGNFAIASLQGFHQHIRDPKEPGGPLRFGFGWLTNFKSEESVAVHHRALRDLITVLVANEKLDSKRIFLLGFSQSCALNYRFAFTHPELLRGVIGIAGGFQAIGTRANSTKPESSVYFISQAPETKSTLLSDVKIMRVNWELKHETFSLGLTMRDTKLSKRCGTI